MRFSTTLSLFTLVCGGQAFTIPSDIPGGTYSVGTDKDGNDVFIRLDDPSPTPLSWTQNKTDVGVDKRSEKLVRSVHARDNGVVCGCGFTLDHHNCDTAVNDLSGQLNGGNPDVNLSYFAIAGDGSARVVAFFCRGNGAFWEEIFGQDYGDHLKTVTNRCGAYIAGTWWDNGWGYKDGYMRYSDHLDFCAAALGSSATHC